MSAFALLGPMQMESSAQAQHDAAKPALSPVQINRASTPVFSIFQPTAPSSLLIPVDGSGLKGNPFQLPVGTVQEFKGPSGTVAQTAAPTDATAPTASEQGSPALPTKPEDAISPSLVDPGLNDTKMETLPEADTTDQTEPGKSSKEETNSEASQETDGPKKPIAGEGVTDTPSSTMPGKPGPKLRAPFSVLFTEQKPFLLYSQDASITYLMPNAVRNHPIFGRYLRSILEKRAMNFWQQVRQKSDNGEDASKAPARSLILSSRIEDRFTSSAYSSLFWQEDVKFRAPSQKEKVQTAVYTINYDYKSDKPLSLQDLFVAEDDQILDSIVDLIAAYIRADIIRQKSIRLTTKISAEQDAWVKEFQPEIAQLQTFSFVPSSIPEQIAGLTFHFGPGQLGAEADGAYHVYVPAAIFSPYLSEPFAKLFAGDALNVGSHTASGFSNALVNLKGIKDGAELAGTMAIEGEVPANWCDGFHLTLTDQGTIVSEANVELLPDLSTFGLSSNMIRFRAELSVSGEGGKNGQLVFEPFALTPRDGRIQLRENSACALDKDIVPPMPGRDSIAVPVSY